MVLEESFSPFRGVPPSISFSGSGFMATYQLGVAQGFLNYAPWIVRTAPSVLGASAGSLVAAAVVCEMSLITIKDEMLNFAKQMMSFTLGPLNPSVNVFHWLEWILQKHLPSNAHQLANRRLAVSMTRLTDGKHIVISEYKSKEDVLQALLCSCFVPMYCGMLPPSLNGVYYVDGGFSCMQPVLSLPNQTLTVCPFAAEADICPSDVSSMFDMVASGSTLRGNMLNFFRLVDALYPTALENLDQAYNDGYKDAFHFLLNNELLPSFTLNMTPQVTQDCNQNNTFLESFLVGREEEETTEVRESPTSTSYQDNEGQQTTCFTDYPLPGKQTTKEPPIPFDTVRDVMLGNLMTYTTMFGHPAQVLTYLLLPVMLSYYTVLQCRHRLELLFKEAPEFVLWTWYAVKYFTHFLYNILIGSIKKNFKDRVMPTVMLVLWLKVLADVKFAAPCDEHVSPACQSGMNRSTSKVARKLQNKSPPKSHDVSRN